uniref:SAP domain-containing protein n=1 Tax=Eptatretus burgeri TaxID=7764 RepID=A0A8C4NNW4_EPTBU
MNVGMANAKVVASGSRKASFADWHVADLRLELEKYGLDISWVKSVLVDCLREARTTDGISGGNRNSVPRSGEEVRRN